MTINILFAIDHPTLNRFYSLHYTLPFVLAGLSIFHIAALHQYGSTNPLGINTQSSTVYFGTYFGVKDLVGLLFLVFVFAFLVFFYPEYLGHPDNLIPANPYSTPHHITPEWYFCAPFNCFLSSSPEMVICTVASLILVLKLGSGAVKRFPNMKLERAQYSAWVESRVSDVVCHNNLRQVNTGKDKFMNLYNDLVVPPWPYRILPLIAIVMYVSDPESVSELDAMTLYTSSLLAQSQGPNPDSEESKNSVLPKDRKIQGNREVEVGRNTEGPQSNVRDPEIIINSKGRDGLFELRSKVTAMVKEGNSFYVSKLVHLISDVEVLILAYELIKSNPGNMTPGSSKETLDGVDMEYLKGISAKLKSGKYTFSTGRRVWIPKPGKPDLRPLTMASPREKIVQKAMELVLSSIYEPMFLETSHGFRPNKGTHTALRFIDQKFKGVAWFIEADISKCFDTITHQSLTRVISKKVQCYKTLALINSGLKAGWVDKGTLVKQDFMGTPQGSVVSPLLCNIYLHELDLFMEKLQKAYDKGRKRCRNPVYTRFVNNLAKTDSKAERRVIHIEMRKHSSVDLMDKKFVRVRYVRYADDFLISVIGPHTMAIEIKERISEFLETELQLKMHPSKTLITNASKGKAFFLGTVIQWRTHSEKKVVLTKTNVKTRITPRMALLAPLDKLLSKLVIRKFIKYRANGRDLIAMGLKRIQNMDHCDIVAYYNSVIRGILNYYSFADNRSSLGSIVRLLHQSCARTLALKYKLRRMSKCFAKYGTALTCPITKVSLFMPGSLKRIRTFSSNPDLNLQSLEKSWSNKLTRSNLGKKCIVCGASPVQMHHVRMIKELRSRNLDWYTMQMAAINRKQVPLCMPHHKKLHCNGFTPDERLSFQSGCIKLVKG